MRSFLSMHRAPRSAFALLLCTLAGPIRSAERDAADADSQRSAAVEEIVVSGSRLPPSVTTFPGSVTVLDQKLVEKQANFTSDLAAILAFEIPGLGTSSNSSSNFHQRLRGRKMAVYIDGIPVSAPLRDGGRDLRVLDASAIARIEVIRGSSALYGSGGAGGTINYLTKTPTGENGLRGSSQITVGSSLTHPGDSIAPLFRQNLEAVYGGFNVLFSGSYEKYDSFFDADGDRIPPNPDGNGGVSESQTASAYLKAGYNFGGRRIEAAYLRYDQDQDSDYLQLVLGNQLTGLKTVPIRGTLSPRDGQEFNLNEVAQISYADGHVFGGDLRAQLFFQDIDQQFAWNPARAGGSNSRIESQKTGARLDFNTPLAFLRGDSRLLWGAESVTDKSIQTVNTTPIRVFVPELEQTDTALFAQALVEITPRLTLQGGVRYDDLDLEVASFNVLATGLAVMGGKTSYRSTVFNVGANFKLTEALGVFGGFSQGFSLPDVGRVFRDTRNTNPIVNLRPEPIEIDNYELGLRVNAGGVSATLAAFFNTSDLGELFVPDPNAPPGVLEFIVTRQAQDFWGVEATLNGPLFGDRGRWGTSFTWIDGEQDTDGDGDPDGPIENTSVPPIKITAFTDYLLSEKWSLRVQALYSGDRNEFPTQANTSNGDLGHVRSFWTVDASTQFKVGPGEMSIAVTNLFNKQYFPTSATRSGNRPERFSAAPGAIARLGYVVRF